MAYLILVRHGKSIWNEEGKWTGWTDVELTDDGRAEARHSAEVIADLPVDGAYTAPLIRTRETLQIILEENGWEDIPVSETRNLLERNYGIYTGQNKWEVKEKVGERIFKEIRRGWDFPIPEGENLKTVYNRVVPFYKNEILPRLKDGENILISASGNSLRALVKYLDNLSIEDLKSLEIGLGEVSIYQIDTSGKVVSQEIRAEPPNKGAI